MYYIIYPRGNKKKLMVIELTDGLEYELSDYDVASKNSFYDIQEAIEYGKDLAKKHNLELSVQDRDIGKELNYLD
jgi:hypothetical protein